MKSFIVIILVILFVSACSKEEEQRLQLFTPEAFAYDVGDAWEVNVTFHAKGFTQKEENSQYYSKLDYSIDLVTPDKDTLKNIFSNSEEDTFKEKAEDIELEAQFDLDSTYRLGNYNLLIHVKDELSNRTAKISKNFELSN